MKRKKLVFIAIFILIISAILFLFTEYYRLDVVVHRYSFTGENKQWVATYKAHSSGFFYEISKRLKYNGQVEKSFNLTYNGDLEELSAAKKVEYKLSTGEGGTSSFEGVPSRNIFRNRSKGEGLVIITADYIDLTVIIGDNAPENIKLYKAK